MRQPRAPHRGIGAAIALVVLPVAAHALEVEFQVPVKMRELNAAATHAVMTCGSFARGAFVKSAEVSVPLQGTDPKYLNTVVKVAVVWPDATVPEPDYRCTLGIRGPLHMFLPNPASVYDRRQPSTVTRTTTTTTTTVVATLDGSFAEMRSQALADKVTDGGRRLPKVPAPK